MKIGIVANCQGQILSNTLQKLPGVESVVHLPIHLFGTEHFNMVKEKFDTLKKERDSIILTQFIGDRFGEYQTDNLKRNSDAQVFTISNLFFFWTAPRYYLCRFSGSEISISHGRLS